MTKNNVKFTAVLCMCVVSAIAWIVSAIVAGVTGNYISLVPVMWVSVVSVLGIVEVWRIK